MTSFWLLDLNSEPGAWLELRTRRDPAIIGLERNTKPVVTNLEKSISTTLHSLRHDLLNLLSHDADIGRRAAVVDEAVKSEAIAEVPKHDDVMLEPHVGTPTATPKSSTTSPAKTSSSAAEATPPKPPTAEASSTGAACMARAAKPASARAPEATSPEAAASRGEGRSPTRAHSSARRLPIGYPPGLDIPKGIVTPRATDAADASWAANPTDPARATCASNAAWTAGAANSSWPASPSGAARTTDASDASNASWPANAPWATHPAATAKVRSTLCSAWSSRYCRISLHAWVVVSDA